MDLQSPCPSTVEEEVEALYLARHGPVNHQQIPYYPPESDACCVQHSTCRNCYKIARDNVHIAKEMKKDDNFERSRYSYGLNGFRELSASEYPMEPGLRTDKSGCINIIADVHSYNSSTEKYLRGESTKSCGNTLNKSKLEKHRKHSLDLIAQAHDDLETAAGIETSKAEVKTKNKSKKLNRYKPPDNYYNHNGPGTMKHNLSFPGTSKSSHFLPDDSKGKHSYLTKYGFEENIYEEVSDTSSNSNTQEGCLQHSLISLNQSMLEEEVRRVESKHLKILGELNLSMEALLMPDSESSDSEKEKESTKLDDLIGPTDELLSPATYNPLTDLDSGFSGSSSGASYMGSLHCKPEPDRPKSSQSFLRPSLSVSSSNHNLRQVVYDTKSVKILGVSHHSESFNSSARSSTSGDTIANSNSFWKKKSWKKLPGFSSSSNIEKAGLSGLLTKSTSRSKSSPRSPTINTASQTAEVCETCLKQRC